MVGTYTVLISTCNYEDALGVNRTFCTLDTQVYTYVPTRYFATPFVNMYHLITS